MKTCEICGQRVEENDPKSVTRYYIPWCENEIERLNKFIKEFQYEDWHAKITGLLAEVKWLKALTTDDPSHGNEFAIVAHYKHAVEDAIEEITNRIDGTRGVTMTLNSELSGYISGLNFALNVLQKKVGK